MTLATGIVVTARACLQRGYTDEGWPGSAGRPTRSIDGPSLSHRRRGQALLLISTAVPPCAPVVGRVTEGQACNGREVFS